MDGLISNFTVKLFINSLLLAGLFVFHCSGIAFADSSESSVASSSSTSSSSSSVSSWRQSTPTYAPEAELKQGAWRMVQGLGACLALICVGIWVLKKVKHPLIQSREQKVKLIERLPLGPKVSVALVRIGNREVLVGVGTEQVTLLSDFMEDSSLDFHATTQDIK